MRALIAALAIAGAVLAGVAAPAVAAGAGTISGRLLAADGSALEGAGVSAFSLAGAQVAIDDGYLPGGYFSIEVPAGQYRLQIDSWNIVGNALTPYWRGAATLNGAQVVTVASGQTTAVGDVTVPAGASISGRITTPSGLHLVSPLIYVSTAEVGTDREGRVDASTGDFKVTGLGPGSYVLFVYDQSERQLLPQYWNGKATWGAADRVIVGSGQARAGLEIALQAAPTISGTVVGIDATGYSRPLSGVSIDVLDESGNFVANAETYNGSYTVTLDKPGTYKVRFVYYNPNDSKDWQPQWWGDVGFPSQSAAVTVTSGGAISGIDATMRLGGTISGIAAPYLNGTPIGLVDVLALNPATGTYDLVGRGTPARFTGAYSVPGLRPGTYVVRFIDLSDGHAPEYWPSGYWFADATPIVITQSAVRGGVDRHTETTGGPGPDQVAATSFVSAAYNDVLGRAPSPGDITYWVGTLLAGAPRGAVAGAFNNSDEYRLIKINAAYQNVLGRAGESSGVRYWLGMMRAGVIQPDDVHRIFLSSNEFYDHQGGGTPVGYVAALYQDQMGRAPEAAGSRYWAGFLQQQGRGPLVDALWYSTETYQKRVIDAYSLLLGRAPEGQGLAYWVGVARANGLTAMRTQIMSSGEYYNRAQVRF